MKKYVLGSVVVTAALLVGCNSGSGECCGANERNLTGLGAKQQPVAMPPVAKIDVNFTTSTSENKSDAKSDVNNQTVSVPPVDVNREITFVFGCKNSFDNDSFDANENNKSIESCDWNVTMPGRCSGDNISRGSTVKLICADDLANKDIILVRLKVTDDENQTAVAETNATF